MSLPNIQTTKAWVERAMFSSSVVPSYRIELVKIDLPVWFVCLLFVMEI